MNEQKFTHDNEVFSTMWKNFDLMLERTVSNMIMRNADESTVTLKIAISFDKKTMPGENGGFRNITQPSFKHDLSSVMQVKDKMSGTYKGNVELLFDENGKPIVRDIDDGQMNIFNDDGSVSIDDDEGATTLGLPPAKLGLPESTVVDAEFEEAEETDDEPSLTPFDWLMDFRNQAMRVTEAAGTYTVRSCDDNKVILSTAFVKDSPFHVDAEKIKKHEGHALICVGSPEDAEIPDAIEIWCDECGDFIFGLDNPHKGETEEHETPEDEPDYPYEEPEGDDK